MQTPAPSQGTVGDFMRGVSMPLKGMGLLFSRPGLGGLAALPALCTALLTLVSAFLMVRYGDLLVRLVWEKPGACEGCGLGARLWAGIGVAAWYTAWASLGALVTVAIAVVVSRIATAPLMDLLAERVMKQQGARPPAGVAAYGDLPLHRAIPMSLLRALGRTALLVAGYVALAGLSLIPGAAVVTTPLGLLWTGVWLFADTALYALQWVGPAELADVRALTRARPALTFGFALATGLFMLVPLAGLLITPAAVAGACLLVVEVSKGPKASLAAAG